MFEISKIIKIKLIFIISVVALASAFFIEHVLGHQPCNLCILERIPYLLAIIIIILNYKFVHIEKLSILLLILIFVSATILSLYHLFSNLPSTLDKKLKLILLCKIKQSIFCYIIFLTKLKLFKIIIDQNF